MTGLHNLIYTLINLVPYVCYCIIMFGLFLFVKNPVYKLFESIAISKQQKKKEKIETDFDLLLKFNFGTIYPIAKQLLFLIMAIIFGVMFFILKHLPIITRILIPIVFSLVPLLVLYLRRTLVRVQSSYEGIEVVSELITQYSLANKDIYRALDGTVQTLKSSPNMKKSLYVFSSTIKEIKSVEQLNTALNLLITTVDTEWSKILANLLYFAIKEKEDISVGLSDVLSELKNAKVLYERSNRLNIEGFMTAYFMLPVTYFASGLLYQFMFDVPYYQFFVEQFATPQSTKTFLMIVGLLVANIIIISIFRKRKFDM